MKKAVKILSLFVFAILLLVFVPGLQGTKHKILDFLKNDNHIISINFDNESMHVAVRSKEKEVAKKAVKKIKGFIFREATEHNPPGDLVPDAIDDKVMDSIKKHVN